jgi:hypothetical protein
MFTRLPTQSPFLSLFLSSYFPLKQDVQKQKPLVQTVARNSHWLTTDEWANLYQLTFH